MARPFRRCALLVAVWLVGGTASAQPAGEVGSLCSECHEQDTVSFAESVHGVLECADCHAGAGELPHDVPLEPVDCAMCHVDTVEAYRGSVHARQLASGHDGAPGCASCHGDVHAIDSHDAEASPVHATHLVETCGRCHGDAELIGKHRTAVVRPIAAYRDSVHARVVAERGVGPTCNDCHDSHAILPASDPRSTVFHPRVPETCGACHDAITEAYRSSVHGRAATEGVRESPVCTDCHGEHRILAPSERGSPVFASNIPRMTCGRCHGDLRLAEKFGMPTDKVPAYEDSYHGLAARGGSQSVAHCASCHGVHDILPSSDPRSHVHPERLPETCGACHAGAGTRFALGPVHVLPTSKEHAAVFWVRRIYLALIVLAVGGMLLHNGLDFLRKLLRPPAVPPRTTPVPAERMSRMFRIAHGLLAASFGVLVYSGFALTYPEAWWASPILAWEESFGLRGIVHRVAAVVMLGALVLHALQVALDRRARACMALMRPARHDWVELRERVRWMVGRRPDPPHTPRVGYAEKIEYLALLWGMLVMTLSGFLLWFESAALRWLPKWAMDVATAVHFYEAVLATLAIVVWHLYFVVFDPVVYPLDTACVTGRSAPGRAEERGELPSASRDGKNFAVDEKTCQAPVRAAGN